jgi:ADP-ribose pyrophosphatase YjhB (NUDIX family)
MESNKPFQFCPRCRSASFFLIPEGCYACIDCDFHFFFNTATGAGAIVVDDEGRILLLRRARNPDRGKLGLPGGFVHPGETAEETVLRETMEEINLELSSPRYLCSYPNSYRYKEVTYNVLDLFYVCHVASFDHLVESDEVDGYRVVKPWDLDLNEIAFPSVRQAVARYRDDFDVPS